MQEYDPIAKKARELYIRMVKLRQPDVVGIDGSPGVLNIMEEIITYLEEKKEKS